MTANPARPLLVRSTCTGFNDHIPHRGSRILYIVKPIDRVLDIPHPILLFCRSIRFQLLNEVRDR